MDRLRLPGMSFIKVNGSSHLERTPGEDIGFEMDQ
jgi:hypothetical protein